MPGPGEFCWETLNTSDVEKAKAFYCAVFGWTIATGPGSDMSVFKAGETMVADVEPLRRPSMPTHWLSHLVVDKLEPARERAAKLGGRVLVPDVTIPQIGRMAVITDSLGAVVSLFQPNKPAA
jgi:uncharacterized protein